MLGEEGSNKGFHHLFFYLFKISFYAPFGFRHCFQSLEGSVSLSNKKLTSRSDCRSYFFPASC